MTPSVPSIFQRNRGQRWSGVVMMFRFYCIFCSIRFVASFQVINHFLTPTTSDLDAGRRALVQSVTSLCIGAQLPTPFGIEPQTLTIPLEWIPSLSAYVLYYSISGSRFAAILDTGSPFLTVAGYCDERRWGCFRPESSSPSGLSTTIERFDNNEGEVEWRRASFSFLNASGSLSGPSEVIFGVLDESLMIGPGGVFFGLVRDTDKELRPSFLGQTNVRAFAIDLASQSKSLTLSTRSLIRDDYIPLVRDLNRRFNDPAVHYTARATSLRVNGNTLIHTSAAKPIYAIFDTGVTGMVVSGDLYGERLQMARQNRERNLWGSVEVTFRTKHGQTVSVTATKPVTTPLGQQPWPAFRDAYLVVLGLAFLDGHEIIVDIDDGKLKLM